MFFVFKTISSFKIRSERKRTKPEYVEHIDVLYTSSQGQAPSRLTDTEYGKKGRRNGRDETRYYGIPTPIRCPPRGRCEATGKVHHLNKNPLKP